jgi:hypothetical protein
MEQHASDVLSPRPVQTPQELNLEKLAKRKTKKTRLSFKQGTHRSEYAILHQVIKCWFAKEGDYWPGQGVGTREHLRHIEASQDPWPHQEECPRALPQGGQP